MQQPHELSECSSLQGEDGVIEKGVQQRASASGVSALLDEVLGELHELSCVEGVPSCCHVSLFGT